MTTIIAPSWELPAVPITELPTRKKSEVAWTGLTGITIAANTDVNLVQWLKGLPTPQYGTLLPFFNTTTNKLNVFNANTSCIFKLNLIGSWSGGAGARSLSVDFVGTLGNRLVAIRDTAVTTDALTLATFLSVDLDGNLVQNGSPAVLRSSGGTFTVTGVLVVAEQTTLLTSISAA